MKQLPSWEALSPQTRGRRYRDFRRMGLPARTAMRYARAEREAEFRNESGLLCYAIVPDDTAPDWLDDSPHTRRKLGSGDWAVLGVMLLCAPEDTEPDEDGDSCREDYDGCLSGLNYPAGWECRESLWGIVVDPSSRTDQDYLRQVKAELMLEVLHAEEKARKALLTAWNQLVLEWDQFAGVPA